MMITFFFHFLENWTFKNNFWNLRKLVWNRALSATEYKRPQLSALKRKFSKKRDYKSDQFQECQFSRKPVKNRSKNVIDFRNKTHPKKQLKIIHLKLLSIFSFLPIFYFYHSIPILTQFLNKHLKSINTRSNLCIKNRFFPTKITYKIHLISSQKNHEFLTYFWSVCPYFQFISFPCAKFNFCVLSAQFCSWFFEVQSAA